MAFEEMEHNFSFVWNILSGKTGLPFQKIRCPENSPMKRFKKYKVVFHLLADRFSWKVFVNGKQTMSLKSQWTLAWKGEKRGRVQWRLSQF